MITRNYGEEVLGHRIKEARILKGYSLEELAKRVGLTRQSMSKYENEDMKISMEKLVDISEVLDFPIDFFKKKKDNLGIGDNPIFFRSLRKTTSKIKESLGQNVEFLEEIFYNISEYIEFPKVNIDFSINKNYKIGVSDLYIEEIAMKMREKWGIGESPINNLVDLLQRNGIIISRIELDNYTVDAFSSMTRSRVPFIILGSDKQSAVRSRMDCAHELGHIILHSHLSKEDIIENHNIIEDEAKRFASAFLLPANEFSKDIYTINLDSFIYIKKRWKVSIAGIIVRSHRLNLITDDQYTYLFKRISAKKWRVKEPLDDIIQIEEPELLKEACNLLFDNGVISKKDFVRFIGFPVSLIEGLCNLEEGTLGKDEKKTFLRLIK